MLQSSVDLGLKLQEGAEELELLYSELPAPTAINQLIKAAYLLPDILDARFPSRRPYRATSRVSGRVSAFAAQRYEG
jgi:hypothetical protein